MSQANNHEVLYQTSILTPLNAESKPAPDTKYKELLAEKLNPGFYRSGKTSYEENQFNFYSDLYHINKYYKRKKSIDFSPCRFIMTIQDNDGTRGLSISKIGVDNLAVPEIYFEISFQNKYTLPFFLRMLEGEIKFRIDEINQGKLSRINYQYIERQFIDSNNIVINSNLLDQACMNISYILGGFG